jgi:hypothetical protein
VAADEREGQGADPDDGAWSYAWDGTRNADITFGITTGATLAALTAVAGTVDYDFTSYSNTAGDLELVLDIITADTLTTNSKGKLNVRCNGWHQDRLDNGDILEEYVPTHSFTVATANSNASFALGMEWEGVTGDPLYTDVKADDVTSFTWTVDAATGPTGSGTTAWNAASVTLTGGDTMSPTVHLDETMWDGETSGPAGGDIVLKCAVVGPEGVTLNGTYNVVVTTVP